MSCPSSIAILNCIALLAVFSPIAQAGFLTDFMHLPEGVLEGITLDPWYSTVGVRENVGRNLGHGFTLVDIHLDAPGELHIVGDPRLVLVPKDESRMIWHLNASTPFDYEDYEMPDDPPMHRPVLQVGLQARLIVIVITNENDNPPLFCSWDENVACRDLAGFTFNVSNEHTGLVETNHEILVKDFDKSSVPFGEFTASFGEGTPEEVTNSFWLAPSEGVWEQEFQLYKNESTSYGPSEKLQFGIEITSKRNPEQKAYGLFTGFFH